MARKVNKDTKSNRFIPFDKMQKSLQKEINAKSRGNWGGVKPVTQVEEKYNAYSRKVKHKKKIETYGDEY